MSSNTKPGWDSYGIVLIVGLIATIVAAVMYYRQLVIAAKNKCLAEDYKAATNLKSMFLAEMSHELRTPLNGIVGTIDILSTFDLTREVCEYVTDIKECSNMLLSTISEILDFSKIEGRLIGVLFSCIFLF